MTVSSTVSVAQFLGNGATRNFPFPYPFFAPSDLVITLVDSTGAPVASVLNGANTYDFVVNGVLDPTIGEYLSGASVYFNTAPLGGYELTIQRVVPPTQSTVLSDNTLFPAKAVEAAFDRLTMIAQQLLDVAARAIVVPEADPDMGTALTLPSSLARAGFAFTFDADGSPTVSLLPTVNLISPVQNVANIAGLRALNMGFASQPSIYVHGYYAAGDGAAGMFTYVPADITSADNGGTIIVDAAGRRYYRDEQPAAMDIRYFGAKCDGVTNDTAAVAAALAACPWVLFPQGVILTTPGALTISREGQRISGSGGIAASDRTNGAGSVLMVNGRGGSGLRINVQFCKLDNFGVSRTLTQAAIAGDHGIEQIHVGGSEVYEWDRVWVENHYDGFHLLTAGATVFFFLVAQNNVNNGFYFSNGGQNQACGQFLIGCLSQNNGNVGFYHAATSVAGTVVFYGVFPSYYASTSYNNASNGYLFSGVTTAGAVATVNDVAMTDSFSSYDGIRNGQDGILFYQTSGFNIRLNGVVSENSGANGINIDASNVSVKLTGSTASKAKFNGFFIGALAAGMANCEGRGNGSGGRNYAGLSCTAGKINVTGGMFTDGGNASQDYGVVSHDGNTFTGAAFDCTGNQVTNLSFVVNASGALLAAVRQ